MVQNQLHGGPGVSRYGGVDRRYSHSYSPVWNALEPYLIQPPRFSDEWFEQVLDGTIPSVSMQLPWSQHLNLSNGLRASVLKRKEAFNSLFEENFETVLAKSPEMPLDDLNLLLDLHERMQPFWSLLDNVQERVLWQRSTGFMDADKRAEILKVAAHSYGTLLVAAWPFIIQTKDKFPEMMSEATVYLAGLAAVPFSLCGISPTSSMMDQPYILNHIWRLMNLEPAPDSQEIVMEYLNAPDSLFKAPDTPYKTPYCDSEKSERQWVAEYFTARQMMIQARAELYDPSFLDEALQKYSSAKIIMETAREFVNSILTEQVFAHEQGRDDGTWKVSSWEVMKIREKKVREKKDMVELQLQSVLLPFTPVEQRTQLQKFQNQLDLYRTLAPNALLLFDVLRSEGSTDRSQEKQALWDLGMKNLYIDRAIWESLNVLDVINPDLLEAVAEYVEEVMRSLYLIGMRVAIPLSALDNSHEDLESNLNWETVTDREKTGKSFRG